MIEEGYGRRGGYAGQELEMKMKKARDMRMERGGGGDEEGGGTGRELGFGTTLDWGRCCGRMELSLGWHRGCKSGQGPQDSPSGSSRRASPRCCSAVRKALCRL